MAAQGGRDLRLRSREPVGTSSDHQALAPELHVELGAARLPCQEGRDITAPSANLKARGWETDGVSELRLLGAKLLSFPAGGGGRCLRCFCEGAALRPQRNSDSGLPTAATNASGGGQRTSDTSGSTGTGDLKWNFSDCFKKMADKPNMGKSTASIRPS